MKTICFTDKEQRKKGLRVITLSGPVVFAGNRTYRVPDYTLNLLEKYRINYKVLNHHRSGEPLEQR